MVTEDGRRTIIVLSVLTPVTTVFLGLRLAIRQSRRVIGIDDGLLCFALVILYLRYVGAVLVATKGGQGIPMKELTPDQLHWFLKMSFWPELGYSISIVCIKTSILVSYMRIFGQLRWFRSAVYVIGTLTVIWGIGHFFSCLFQCTPIHKAWDPRQPGHCIDLLDFFWANSISNSVLDYLILLLPVVPVWKLHMEPIQKALILGSFALGSLACIVSTLRAASTGTIDPKDISRSESLATLWVFVEPEAGMVSACLPFLANNLGRRLLELCRVLSRLGSKTLSRLGIRLAPTDRTQDTTRSGTHRATYEAFDLDGSIGPIPDGMRKDTDTESESVHRFV